MAFTPTRFDYVRQASSSDGPQGTSHSLALSSTSVSSVSSNPVSGGTTGKLIPRNWVGPNYYGPSPPEFLPYQFESEVVNLSDLDLKDWRDWRYLIYIQPDPESKNFSSSYPHFAPHLNVEPSDFSPRKTMQAFRHPFSLPEHKRGPEMIPLFLFVQDMSAAWSIVPQESKNNKSGKKSEYLSLSLIMGQYQEGENGEPDKRGYFEEFPKLEMFHKFLESHFEHNDFIDTNGSKLNLGSCIKRWRRHATKKDLMVRPQWYIKVPSTKKDKTTCINTDTVKLSIPVEVVPQGADPLQVALGVVKSSQFSKCKFDVVVKLNSPSIYAGKASMSFSLSDLNLIKVPIEIEVKRPNTSDVRRNPNMKRKINWDDSSSATENTMGNMSEILALMMSGGQMPMSSNPMLTQMMSMMKSMGGQNMGAQMMSGQGFQQQQQQQQQQQEQKLLQGHMMMGGQMNSLPGSMMPSLMGQTSVPGFMGFPGAMTSQASTASQHATSQMGVSLSLGTPMAPQTALPTTAATTTTTTTTTATTTPLPPPPLTATTTMTVTPSLVSTSTTTQAQVSATVPSEPQKETGERTEKD